MFNRLGSAIYQWLQRAYSVHTSGEELHAERDVHDRGASVNSRELCSLNIYKASGGFILEFRRNDPKKDEYDFDLHIIPDDADIEQSMTRIIQIEMMKTR